MSKSHGPYKLACSECGATAEVDAKTPAPPPGVFRYCREALILRGMRRRGWLWRGGPVSTHRAEAVCPRCSNKIPPLRLEEDASALALHSERA